MRVEEDDGNISSLKMRKHDNLHLPSELLVLENVNITIRNKIGDEMDDEASYDSEYILSAMHCVCPTIWKSYHWIDISWKCYLVIDSSSGHRTHDAIRSYTKTIENDYNIEIIFQIPR